MHCAAFAGQTMRTVPKIPRQLPDLPKSVSSLPRNPVTAQKHDTDFLKNEDSNLFCINTCACNSMLCLIVFVGNSCYYSNHSKCLIVFVGNSFYYSNHPKCLAYRLVQPLERIHPPPKLCSPAGLCGEYSQGSPLVFK